MWSSTEIPGPRPSPSGVVLEELWLLPDTDSSSSVDALLKAVAQAKVICQQVEHATKEDAQVHQIWWAGQWVGVAVLASTADPEGDHGALVDWLVYGGLAKLGMKAHVLRTDLSGQQLIHLDAHDGMDPSQPTARLPPSFPSAPSISSARQYLVSTRALDVLLNAPQPFEALAMKADLTDFEDALKAIEWNDDTLGAWWRCSQSWLHRSSVLPAPGNALGFDADALAGLADPDGLDVAHQVRVVELLARAVPASRLDLDYAGTVMETALKPYGFWSRTPMEMASLHWLRTLVGPDEAWKRSGMGVSFDNPPVAFQVEWFSELSELSQHQALSAALSERRARIQKLNLQPENMAVSVSVPALFAACPDWKGWPQALEDLTPSKRGQNLVEKLRESMERHAMAKALSCDLPDPVVRPRSRM